MHSNGEPGRTAADGYQQLIHSLAGIVWEADAETWQFTFVSPRAEAIMGYPVSQWLEESDFRIRHLHPDDVERCVAVCRDTIERGLDHTFEYRMIAVDGRVVWLRDTVAVTRDASGRARLHGFLVDITGQKTAEHAALGTDRLYQMLIEHSHDTIVMLAADGRTAYVSNSVERQLGFAPAALAGRDYFELVHPDDRGAAVGRLRMALRGETSDTPLPIRVRHQHAGWRVLDTAMSRLANEAGELFAVLNTRDVTELVRATEARRESEQRLEMAFEVAAMGVAEYDFEQSEVAFSASFVRLLGYATAIPHATFDWFLAHVHVDDRASVQEAFELTTGGSHSDIAEIRFRVSRADGAVNWWTCRVRILRGPANAPVRAIALCADFTKQRQLEEQVRQAQKLEAIGQLAGGVAHDFNNLLTVIAGYAETLLASMAVSDAHVGDVVEIRRAAERATLLTQQLLAFSRTQVLRPEVVDANAIVSDIAAMIARLLGRNIELRVDIAPGAAAVLADRGQLEQVLMNLAVNARDAMPFGGTLEIRTEVVELAESGAALYPVTAGHHVLVTVRDTGVGMTAEVRARAFEPFFTTKGPGKGTGIGLSTVYGIVQQSGGYVLLDSEPGRGTRFDIYLPLSAVPLDEPEPRPEPRANTPATILLVDDYRRLRELTRRVLTREGYRVLTAETGADALAQCRDFAGRIDLVVTDVVMAPMSGPELAARLETLRPGLPVLYMSGHTGEMLSDHGVREEGVHFIEKPFTPDALGRRVRDILARGGAGHVLHRHP